MPDPVDGPSGTGAGLAGIGSRYVELGNGDQYENVGSKASPQWVYISPAIYFASIARTDTNPKKLFTLRRHAILAAISVQGVDSNAGQASISIGKTPGGTDYLNDWNVKLMASLDDAVTGLGPIGATDQNVYGVYAESGPASTLGGPYYVVFYLTSQ